MATLVLTSIGTALGGPIGGALGGLIGRSIDQGLFGPGIRKGPRLGDLSVQTSSYGSPIPRIYGAMRVAGTVIWASDLIEREATEGGGKGSPEVQTFSYAANLAVALSSRPIRAIRRIWADGKLIRGAAGDFKVKTGFRLALGGEEQGPDPLIASFEGIAGTPAYRGLALAIFEELELAEFGNRIPLLTFEVIADEGPVPLQMLLADASDGLIQVSDSMSVAGFAGHGTSIGDGLGQLIEVSGTALVDREHRLRSPESNIPFLVAEEELGSDSDSPGGLKAQRQRAAEGDMPAALTMTYYDPERDYQAGQARASSGRAGIGEHRLELAAVIPAGEARRLAEAALSRRWLAGETLKLRLPPTRMALRPGDSIQLAGSPRAWTIRSLAIEGMAVTIEAEAARAAIQPLPADGGRPVTEPDLAIGRSELALFELPPEGDLPAQSPLVWAAASNDGQWKSLAVQLDLGGEPLPGLALVRRSAVGRAVTSLEARSPHILDAQSGVIVQLADNDQLLLNADLDALMAGANLAVVGDELIQFGRADRLEAGRFRLSKLLRGRRGTEWAASTHMPGEPFCLIDGRTMQPVPLSPAATGTALRAVAHGIGDFAPLPETTRKVSGEAMRPPAPCHFAATWADAQIHLRWVRRSHRLWHWLDGIGDSEDGFPELYRVAISGPGGAAVVETSERSLLLDPAELPAETGQSIQLSLVMIGPAALSRPATTTVIL